MKKARIVSIVLIIALVISTSAFATNTRASDQLIKYSANANIDEGSINVTVYVLGAIDATKAGCEELKIYKKVGSSWIRYVSLDEDDADMSVNSRDYLHTHQFDAVDGVEYKVDVTIFAENNDGRDTRDFTFYI